jgi:hypothetical protein
MFPTPLRSGALERTSVFGIRLFLSFMHTLSSEAKVFNDINFPFLLEDHFRSAQHAEWFGRCRYTVSVLGKYVVRLTHKVGQNEMFFHEI